MPAYRRTWSVPWIHQLQEQIAREKTRRGKYHRYKSSGCAQCFLRLTTDRTRERGFLTALERGLAANSSCSCLEPGPSRFFSQLLQALSFGVSLSFVEAKLHEAASSCVHIIIMVTAEETISRNAIIYAKEISRLQDLELEAQKGWSSEGLLRLAAAKKVHSIWTTRSTMLRKSGSSVANLGPAY